MHRIAPSGELLVEMVSHFIQTDKSADAEDLGGLKYRAGVTMIANIDGPVRYLIKKPFIDKRKVDLNAWSMPSRPTQSFSRYGYLSGAV